ncbi:histidine phosphatase family protein [Muricoccus pecuniae]|uniref:Putative phosphoglycerate mutase n=1 Tax=Muricoccus pecuniae TaxID=693023 RepID=A0A840XZ61_9PROT|nr:histidine phosphatase family protein [Roseomonas pecuniae]MBB5692570.1 putative phosphoglycerate mutase [Roseomonas pecuniae]
MSTTFLLIRHAAHDRVGSTLCGRMPGVTLGEEGRRQSAALAARLEREGIAALHTSPMERARETAAPVAARLGIEARVNEGVMEIDFGAWTGRSFASLDGDPDWARWNEERATARTPGGESMAEAQSRALAELERLRARHAGETVAVVTHGDVIKAVLAHHLGLRLNGIHRFEIAPASISAVAAWDGGGKVMGMNETVPA